MRLYHVTCVLLDAPPPRPQTLLLPQSLRPTLFPTYQSIRLLSLPLVFVFVMVLSTATPKLELLFSLLERLDALGCPLPTPCAPALESPWHPFPS